MKALHLHTDELNLRRRPREAVATLKTPLRLGATPNAATRNAGRAVRAATQPTPDEANLILVATTFDATARRLCRAPPMLNPWPAMRSDACDELYERDNAKHP